MHGLQIRNRSASCGVSPIWPQVDGKKYVGLANVVSLFFMVRHGG